MNQICEVLTEGFNRGTSVQELSHVLGVSTGRIGELLREFGLVPKDLTPEQRSVTVGGLLGDSWFERQSGYPLLCFGHSAKQKAYIDWKYEIFRRLCASPPKPDGGGCFCFNTRRHPAFVEFYNLFYPQGKKVILDDIRKELNPLSIAVWYMDDGCWFGDHKDRRGSWAIILCTHSFAVSECEKLIVWLTEDWNLPFRLTWETGYENGIKYPLLYLGRKVNVQRFIDLVGGLIIPTLQYKLGLPRSSSETVCHTPTTSLGEDTVRASQ